MPLLKQKYHGQVFFFALLLLAASLPISNVGMSIAQLVLAGNWILEGNIRTKVLTFMKNKAALVFSSLFLLHLLGLLWTTDFSYALKDLRTKVPLLVLPLILSTTRLPSGKKFSHILLIYTFAVLAGSFISSYIYLSSGFTNIRQISPFISHIRFSLNVCMAIFSIVYMVFYSGLLAGSWKVPALLAAAWLLGFLFILQSFTGLLVISVTITALMLYFSFRTGNRSLRIVLRTCFVLIPLLILGYVGITVRDFFSAQPADLNKLDATTASGNPYFHDTLNRITINGNFLWIYICESEMREAWNRRSRCSYDSVGSSGGKTGDILIRFLTSKGYRKDAAGVDRLTADEVCRVEQGVTDAQSQGRSFLKNRILDILWELEVYHYSRNPNGHSVTMRWEYWKTSLHIIRSHWLAGVGTGDMNTAFENQYREDGSALKKEWQRRSHNQFLSLAVGFGLPGFLWFLLVLIYPPVRLRRSGDFLFFVFFVIIILSMIWEDTIETQAGVTFFAFFFSFLLFLPRDGDG